ncbi:MAG: aminopeptidase P family protein [Hyphomicrobiales bacterium]
MAEAVFQTFDQKTTPAQGAPHLKTLRAELKARGLDGFVVPRTDEHQNEYVPPSSERLAWLTGFSGSWGTAIVLHDLAAIFVDGRYTVQVREQVDAATFTPEHLIDNPPENWLEKHLRSGQKLGFDPWLHTQDSVKKLEKACAKVGAILVPVDTNPIDSVWKDRPPVPLAQVVLHRPAYAGEDAHDKLKRIQAKLAAQGADAVVLTDAHAVAWAFNIRGGDVGHTPLPLGFAIIPREGKAELFMDGRKFNNTVRSAVSDLAEIAEPAALDRALQKLGTSGAKVKFDAASASNRLVAMVESAGGTPEVGTDFIALMKAVKNSAEIAGSRAAHARDGAAMTKFLAWFDREAISEKLTEIDATIALEGFRRETGVLKDVSFPSIAGAGPNAALPHYKVSTNSNRRIEKGIFLIDSGAQYEDGTTDITRTIVVGPATAEMKDRFTRVLKGHIAIDIAVFPKGVSGAQLDSFARKALWDVGLDFDHGTGHGIGSYLSVHEGPQRIAKTGVTPLEPGMMLSNEPGFYKAGQWGIRIENLILVEKRDIPGAEREMYGFETLSFAPIDLNLVEPALLASEERAWLNAYHAKTRAIVGPLVDAETMKWLEKATREV